MCHSKVHRGVSIVIIKKNNEIMKVLRKSNKTVETDTGDLMNEMF